MMTPVALVVSDYVKQPLADLPPISGRLELVVRNSEEIDSILWRRTEVLYTFTALPLPEQAPNLRWVQLFSAGADHALRHPIASQPVVFTSASGVHAIPVAEYTFGMLLGWTRRLPKLLEWQRSGQWPPEQQRMAAFVPPLELWGATMGILGYGSVGRQVARTATALGMKVLAMRRTEGREDPGFSLPGVGDPQGLLPEAFFTPDKLKPILTRSDVVVVSLPLTTETRNLLDADAFRAMKPGAILVDVSRGGIVNEAALVSALREGQVSAAILDVFSPEPLPPESALWTLPNVVMSPHVSGHSPHYGARANQVFVENLRRYLAGETLLNEISRALQY